MVYLETGFPLLSNTHEYSLLIVCTCLYIIIHYACIPASFISITGIATSLIGSIYDRMVKTPLSPVLSVLGGVTSNIWVVVASMPASCWSNSPRWLVFYPPFPHFSASIFHFWLFKLFKTYHFIIWSMTSHFRTDFHRYNEAITGHSALSPVSLHSTWVKAAMILSRSTCQKTSSGENMGKTWGKHGENMGNTSPFRSDLVSGCVRFPSVSFHHAIFAILPFCHGQAWRLSVARTLPRSLQPLLFSWSFRRAEHVRIAWSLLEKSLKEIVKLTNSVWLNISWILVFHHFLLNLYNIAIHRYPTQFDP